MVIRIEAFLPCPEVDTVYFDKPYYLAPPDGVLGESFAVLREGMRRKKMAALARAVLFRRVRGLLLRAEGPGLVANTRSEEHTSELQSLMRISYAVFCLKKKKHK